MAQPSPPEQHRAAATRTTRLLWGLGVFVGWVAYVTIGLLAGLLIIKSVTDILNLKTIPGQFVPVFAATAGFIAGGIAGACAGLIQTAAVRGRFEQTRTWVYATTMGWAVGWAGIWILGELVNDYGQRGVHFGIVGLDPYGATGGAIAWTAVGAIVGVYQWLALRRLGKVQAGWWVPFSAATWCAGAIATWLMGSYLDAGPTMYWSLAYLLVRPDVVIAGVVSSVTGWLVVAAANAFGSEQLLR